LAKYQHLFSHKRKAFRRIAAIYPALRIILTGCLDIDAFTTTIEISRNCWLWSLKHDFGQRSLCAELESTVEGVACCTEIASTPEKCLGMA